MKIGIVVIFLAAPSHAGFVPEQVRPQVQSNGVSVIPTGTLPQLDVQTSAAPLDLETPRGLPSLEQPASGMQAPRGFSDGAVMETSPLIRARMIEARLPILSTPQESAERLGEKRVLRRAAAFKRLFGVEYAPGLVMDKSLPGGFFRDMRRTAKFLETIDRDFSQMEPHREQMERRAAKALAERDFAFYPDEATKAWLYGGKIRDGYVADVRIAKVSDAVGYGVYARQDIRPGEMLGEYTGTVRLEGPEDAGNAYLMRYVDPYVLDAARSGNHTRFINHSSLSPNVEPLHVFYGGAVHVVLIATQEIPRGRQILFDYGDGYWEGRPRPLELDPGR